MNKSVVILGSGNVATHLAKMFQKMDFSIECIWSRHIENALALAEEVDAYAYTDDIASIPPFAGYYIIASSDSAIEIIVRSIPSINPDAILMHTSGSTDMAVLAKGEKYGVLYPCQTFSKNIAFDYNNIDWLIEGNKKETLAEIEQLVELMPHRSITKTDTTQRRTLHMAAVWASNFTNRMIEESHNIMKRANLDPHLLDSLIRQTIDKALNTNPYDAQTGPARRKDQIIMQKHRELLASEPDLAALYDIISQRISNDY